MHIEQITGADLANTLDPQMAGSVASNLLGLRIVDGPVNQLTGAETNTTGFAQAGFVKLYKDGLVTDTIKVGAIAQNGNAHGLTLSNLDHFFLAGMGNDVVLGGTGADVIVGNGGNDWLHGGAGDNILAGGSWDVVTSGDTSFGPIATNYTSTLVGSVGDDVLVAIEGKVRATGGDGENTFAFYGNHTNLNVELTITDFKSGDKIDISKLLTGSVAASTVLLQNILSSQIPGQFINLSSLSSTADTITLKIANTVRLTLADFNLESANATWFDQIERLVKDQITEITEVNLAGQGGVVLGQLEAGVAKREAFIGSSSDDRVVANGGADIFSNFQGADTFLGGADGVVLLNQTNYLHAGESDTPYLHIEQITGADLANTLDPQMAGSVASNLLGLRIVDGPVNQLTGAETNTTGFAQAGFVKLYKDGLVTDTIKVGAIAQNGNAHGLTLSNLDHFFLAGMGNDVVLGGTGADVIVGNGGNDWLHGGAGDNILAGGSWDVVTSGDTSFGPIATNYTSTLVGSVGDDVLVAIEGKVRATGGDGENTFAFYGNHTNLNVELTITDFKSGQDKIDLSKLLGNTSASFDLNAYLQANQTIDANGLHFDLSGLIAQPAGAAANQSNVILTIANAANPANSATLANPEGQISTPVLGDFVTNLAGTDLWFDQLQPLVYPT